MKALKVVSIGGATGHKAILQAIRINYHRGFFRNSFFTGIVTTFDSGGSSGKIGKHFPEIALRGLGDLTKCNGNLSPCQRLAKSLEHKFDKRIQKHSIKNLILLALLAQHSVEDSLELLHTLYQLPRRHRILPVAVTPAQLRAKVVDSRGRLREVRGEHKIGNLANYKWYNEEPGRIKNIFTVPEVDAYEPALQAIREADLIIIPPGDLYSSLLPPFQARGMKEAIQSSAGKTIVFINLMTRKGETDGFSAEKFLDHLKEAMGREFFKIVYNQSYIPKIALSCYGEESKVPIGRTLRFVNNLIVRPVAKLRRVEEKWHLEHDPSAVAEVLREVVGEIAGGKNSKEVRKESALAPNLEPQITEALMRT